MQTWAAPPPGQNYYEISNVFSANGLAPQVPYATGGGHVSGHPGNGGSGATAKGGPHRYSNTSSGNNGGGGHRSNVRVKRNNHNGSLQHLVGQNGLPADLPPHIAGHRNGGGGLGGVSVCGGLNMIRDMDRLTHSFCFLFSRQLPPKGSGKSSSGEGYHISNKHKAPGLVIDEHGMVVGQVVGHQPVHHAAQAPYPHVHNPPRALIMDEAPSHFHGGPKVMLDHNDNELPSGAGHAGHYHRMGGGSGAGGMVNGGAKDPNWRPPRRRRKEDEDRGLSAGVRLYMNANPHLTVTSIAAGPYTNQVQQQPHHHHHNHHHAQQPVHHHPSHQSHNHQPSSSHPHPKKMPPPASPNQSQSSHSSHANASLVPRDGHAGSVSAAANNNSNNPTNPILTAIHNNPAATLANNEQQSLLIPVVTATGIAMPLVSEPPVRSRRDPHPHGNNSNSHHGAASGNAASALAGVSAAGGAVPAVGNQRTVPVQFDLAASAFPPLPGSSSSSAVVVVPVAAVAAGAAEGQPQVATATQPSNAKNLSSVVNALSYPTAAKTAAAKDGDLGAPLLSLVAAATDNNQSSSADGGVGGTAAAAAPNAPAPTVPISSGWGDSLADVVKGTAKAAKSSTNANGEST